MSCRSLDGSGLELSRGHYFQDSHVVAMGHFGVADQRRLIDDRALLQPYAADVLVFELHPAIDHVDELKTKIVRVPLAVRMRPGITLTMCAPIVPAVARFTPKSR